MLNDSGYYQNDVSTTHRRLSRLQVQRWMSFATYGRNKITFEMLDKNV